MSGITEIEEFYSQRKIVTLLNTSPASNWKLINQIKEQFKKKDKIKVVEFGFGDGTFGLLLAAALDNVEYTGYELLKSKVRKAKENQEEIKDKLKCQVNFLHGEILEVSKTKIDADVILIPEVFVHLEYDQIKEVISNLKKSLRKEEPKNHLYIIDVDKKKIHKKYAQIKGHIFRPLDVDKINKILEDSELESEFDHWDKLVRNTLVFNLIVASTMIMNYMIFDEKDYKQWEEGSVEWNSILEENDPVKTLTKLSRQIREYFFEDSTMEYSLEKYFLIDATLKN